MVLLAPTKAEKPKAETRDYWTADGLVFVLNGKGYCVSPAGRTVCIGRVTPDGEPLDGVLSGGQALPNAERVVAKIADKGITIGNTSQAQNNGIMQHRGRPRKEGEVHRTTKWRREKSGTQGVLL